MVARYLKGLEEKSAGALAFQQAKRAWRGERIDGGFRYLKLDRMAYYVHKDSYLKALRHHARTLGA